MQPLQSEEMSRRLKKIGFIVELISDVVWLMGISIVVFALCMMYKYISFWGFLILSLGIFITGGGTWLSQEWSELATIIKSPDRKLEEVNA